MNLYITREKPEKLRKCFLNMRKQHVISVPDIILQGGFGEGPEQLTEYSRFLINEEIKNQIKTVARAKRAHSIIYSNPDLNDEIVRFLVFYVNENTEIADVIFLTSDGSDEDLYELFDGVSLFPSVKKVHIKECRPIESPLYQWIRDLHDEH